ncbi:hypothetical protein MDOR_35770 [Mycolicibacterium doricum]|uniref:Uncharacterized protein n=1 Tax=Mycolicibacterium doricum TaxID=126673 RepID=A0A7I7W0R5_9MYCO|nr:hypothetical protein MDOR_35770 [Mycolicibacterium doricum]
MRRSDVSTQTVRPISDTIMTSSTVMTIRPQCRFRRGLAVAGATDGRTDRPNGLAGGRTGGGGADWGGRGGG